MSLTWYTHVRGYEWDGNGRGGQMVAGGKGVREREVSGCYSTRYKPQRDKMKGNTRRRRRIRPNLCLYSVVVPWLSACKKGSESSTVENPPGRLGH